MAAFRQNNVGQTRNVIATTTWLQPVHLCLQFIVSDFHVTIERERNRTRIQFEARWNVVGPFSLITGQTAGTVKCISNIATELRIHPLKLHLIRPVLYTFLEFLFLCSWLIAYFKMTVCSFTQTQHYTYFGTFQSLTHTPTSKGHPTVCDWAVLSHWSLVGDMLKRPQHPIFLWGRVTDL